MCWLSQQHTSPFSLRPSPFEHKTTDRIDSTHAPEAVGAYPYARKVGGLIFLSGIGPRKRGESDIPGVTQDTDGNVVAKDIEALCRSCFDNVKVVMDDAQVP